MLQIRRNWRIPHNLSQLQGIQTFGNPEDQSFISMHSKGTDLLEHHLDLVLLSLHKHHPQGILPYQRQIRDNVALRNAKWRKSFSCIPFFDTLFYTKFYFDKKPLMLREETKTKTIKKICLHIYTFTDQSQCIYRYLSFTYLRYRKCDGPRLFTHSVTVVEKQFWREDFIFLGWEGGIKIKQTRS